MRGRYRNASNLNAGLEERYGYEGYTDPDRSCCKCGGWLVAVQKDLSCEFVKPIREAQLDLYREASSAASKLSTLSPKEDEWKTARDEFLRLYYGPLAMVEDYRHGPSDGTKGPTVEQAMIAFKTCLDDQACVSSDTMRNLSLALAHTCRISLGASWGFQATQLEGDYQRLIEQYLASRK